jgi:hypothetical protein
VYYCTVFRIRDILVHIQIQILGSVPLTNGSVSLTNGSGSFALFVSDLQDTNKKIIFSNLFCLLVLEVIKVIKKSPKSKNKGFSYSFCLMMEGSGSRRPKILWNRRSGSGTLLQYIDKSSILLGRSPSYRLS